MTPAAFAAAYVSTARAVSDGTGIDSAVLLAQWANETAWGTVVVGNNLGNIRCSPTTFCRYASLADFATDCIATFHNGNYGPVLAARTPEAQLAAIVASPWSSDHYGGNLHPFYDPLEAYEMTPEEHGWLNEILSEVRGTGPFANLDRIAAALGIPSPDTADPAIIATTAQLAQAVADLKTAIAAVPTAGGLTPPQAQALADIHGAITRIENALKSA